MSGSRPPNLASVSTASGTAISASLPHSARDVAVLPGKTGPDCLEPGLTGTGSMDIGSMDIGSMETGMTGLARTASALMGFASPGPGSERPAIGPAAVCSSGWTVPCCRGIVHESGRVVTRWSALAPRSARSSDCKRSKTVRSTTATSRAFWEWRKCLSPTPSIPHDSRIESSQCHPGPNRADTWANCILEATAATSVKPMTLRDLCALDSGSWE